MFVFTPTPGTTWNLTVDNFTQALHRREGDEAYIHTHADAEGSYGPRDEHDWWFAFSATGESWAGTGSPAAGDHEGVALDEATAGAAAEFAAWVLRELVPPGAGMEYNTRVGMESGLPDEVLTENTVTELDAVFRKHLKASSS
ncbi:hypothetical protein ACIG5E_31475 [Kitasatospora sp. NPDC053057]|uniref:hypothetical protein n=1 Tax=Kitasatospora sp. NPDC053057 TaxID=3364062 RepID=UPI0037C563E3